MKEKYYLLISAAIFAVVAVLHLARLIAHLSVQVGATTFPVWGSWLSLIIAVALSLWGLRLAYPGRRHRHT